MTYELPEVVALIFLAFIAGYSYAMARKAPAPTGEGAPK